MPDRTPHLHRAAAAVAVTCVVGVLVATSVSATLTLGAAVLIVVAATLARRAASHHRLTRGLLRGSVAGELAGTRVQLAPIGRSAFVVGLYRPVIFCDHGLADGLTADELRAVTLHERGHQLARDPLRMTAVAAIAPVARRWRSGRRWLERVAARREIAADRYAIARGATRHAIASALVKVSPAGPAGSTGFATAVDLRLRALLGEDVGAAAPSGWLRWVVVGIAVGVGMCVATFFPHVAM